jgi:hypothetical protein
MTALNAIVQGKKAYLVTDAAMLDFEGRIHSLSSKVWEFPARHMAFGVTGVFDPKEDVPEMATFELGNDPFSGLDDLVFDWKSRNVDQAKKEGRELDTRVQITAVAFLPLENRAAACTVASDDAGILGPAYEAGTILRAGYIASPGLDFEGVFGNVSPVDRMAFNVPRRAKYMIQHQRPMKLHHEHFGIGGFAELTTVDAKGIRREKIHSWPEDSVGEKIVLG